MSSVAVLGRQTVDGSPSDPVAHGSSPGSCLPRDCPSTWHNNCRPHRLFCLYFTVLRREESWFARSFSPLRFASAHGQFQDKRRHFTATVLVAGAGMLHRWPSITLPPAITPPPATLAIIERLPLIRAPTVAMDIGAIAAQDTDTSPTLTVTRDTGPGASRSESDQGWVTVDWGDTADMADTADMGT